jgi:hypothetical protein
VLTLREYLPLFFQLRTLIFLGTDIERTIPEHLDLFSAFQHTLSLLFIREASITWSAFVALVGYFPDLRDLEILLMSLRWTAAQSLILLVLCVGDCPSN